MLKLSSITTVEIDKTDGTAGRRRVNLRLKFEAPATSGPEFDAAHLASINSCLKYNRLEGTNPTIVGTPRITKRPSPSTKPFARINKQHDYISLAVGLPGSAGFERATITWSRYANRISGSVNNDKVVVDKLMRAMDRDRLADKVTIGDMSEAFLAVAQKAATMAAFADGCEAWVKSKA